MATVDPARHSIRPRPVTRGLGFASQKGSTWSSEKPQREGSSSMRTSRTAPASASMPGMMCDRTQTASTMLAQPRQVPSRTTRAKSPRNRMARERLNE